MPQLSQSDALTQTVLRKSDDGEADTVDFILERLDAAWGSHPQLLELAGASEQLSSIGVLEPRAAVSGHCRSLHQVNARHELGCCSYGGSLYPQISSLPWIFVNLPIYFY